MNTERAALKRRLGKLVARTTAATFLGTGGWLAFEPASDGGGFTSHGNVP